MSWKWMKTFSISPNFLSKANIGLTGTNEKFLNKNIINVPHLPAAKVQLLPHNIFKTRVCFLHFQRQFKVCVAFSLIFLHPISFDRFFDKNFFVITRYQILSFWSEIFLVPLCLHNWDIKRFMCFPMHFMVFAGGWGASFVVSSCLDKDLHVLR